MYNVSVRIETLGWMLNNCHKFFDAYVSLPSKYLIVTQGDSDLRLILYAADRPFLGLLAQVVSGIEPTVFLSKIPDIPRNGRKLTLATDGVYSSLFWAEMSANHAVILPFFGTNSWEWRSTTGGGWSLTISNQSKLIGDGLEEILTKYFPDFLSKDPKPNL